MRHRIKGEDHNKAKLNTTGAKKYLIRKTLLGYVLIC